MFFARILPRAHHSSFDPDQWATLWYNENANIVWKAAGKMERSREPRYF